MKHAALGAMALSIAAVCGPALAQTPVQVIAYTAKPVNLRAGPSRDYPVVAVLPASFQVLVQGCLDTYAWCDVMAGYDRGWVYAGNITYQYDNRWQPLLSWAPVIGIAVLPFVFDDYWHQHYWNRPFYQDRSRWEHLPPRRHLRPPPRPDGWRPPAQVQPGDRRGPHERPGAPPQRPRGVAPGQAAPGVHPVPQRPPGWQPQPRVGPVPRPQHQQQQEGQQRQRQHQPQAPQRQGGEPQGPRGDRDRR